MVSQLVSQPDQLTSVQIPPKTTKPEQQALLSWFKLFFGV